jgi:hypothetical protein
MAKYAQVAFQDVQVAFIKIMLLFKCDLISEKRAEQCQPVDHL